ncbi:MAG: Si-specific NAD(P)(+) transhydrogenase [Thermoguttaceae bacterium]
MTDKTKEHDLVVIGGGPAGIFGATTAAFFKKSVALVDSHHELGGAGVNTGTAPSKTLRETALALSAVRSRKLYGVDLSLRREATVADFLRHERKVTTGLNAMLARRMEVNRVDVHCGTGIFVDTHTIRVTCRRTNQAGDQPPASNEILLRGERILIATGSSPVRPPIFPFGPSVYDSDTILQLDRLPKTMAVVGAGVIGSEYACTFAALGAEVHVVDGRKVLLPFLDGEISRALTADMEYNGIIFHWGERAETCVVEDSVSSRKLGRVTLKLSSGLQLKVDEALIAAGRKSNIENLNLSAAGVAVGDRGIIHVDEEFRTNVPNIYAAGDVIGFPALASTSMEQGRRAVQHALELPIISEIPRLLPIGIYTIPEVGTVGDTEEALKRQGIDYIVGRASYQDSARGRIIGDTTGFLKLLFRRNDMKLLGVHVIGQKATEVVHVGLMAMLAGATAVIFDEACFNEPTLDALYKFAALEAILSLSDSENINLPAF